MIHTVALRNFKAHEDLVLSGIPPLSVIVGANNVGKSAILQALAIKKYGFSQAANLPIGTSTDIFRTGKSRARIEVTPGPDVLATIIEVLPGNGATITEPPKKDANALPAWKPDDVLYLGPYREVATSKFTYADINDAMGVGIDGSGTWNTLFQMKVRDDARFKEVSEAAASLGMGLDSLLVEALTAREGQVRTVGRGEKTNIFYTGSGSQCVLPVVTQIAMTPQGWTLLVEEPEAHLHREAIDGLVEYMGKSTETRGIQVIATTHSIDFLTSLWHRVESGKLSKATTVFMIERNSSGQTKCTALQPAKKPFKEFLVDYIKPILAGRPAA
jgi:energy-coupling factor transporter ATP-binding protein EcfA2